MRKAVPPHKKVPRSSRTGSEGGHHGSVCEHRCEGLTALHPAAAACPKRRRDGGDAGALA